MMKYIKYLWAVLRHKWFVMLECFNVGLIWRGIVHDWTKFLPDEFIPYARKFYGGQWPESPSPFMASVVRRTQAMVDREFDLAWNKHQKRHDHHWQFWLLSEDDPDRRWSIGSYDQTKPDVIQHPEYGDFWLDRAYYGDDYIRQRHLEHALLNTPDCLPMSDKARLEMLCDWCGAGRAYGNPDTKGWYLKHRLLMRARLHPDTRAWVEKQLGIE